MRVTEAIMHARQVMDHHGLVAWQLKMDMATRRTGMCDYEERAIYLSVHLCQLNDLRQVMLTTLHEVAHALVGPGHGHDAVWAARALEIGGDGKSCYDPMDKRMPGRYVGVCVCGREHRKVRRPRTMGRWKCSCGEMFSFADTRPELAAERPW